MEYITAEELMQCIGELPDTYRAVLICLLLRGGLAIVRLPNYWTCPRVLRGRSFFRARQLLQKKVIHLMECK